jgi:hypothetical protein
MVEKVNALCKAIDTINSLPKDENTDARLAELSEMLLAECKQMVNTDLRQKQSKLLNKIEANTRPKTEQFVAGNDIEPGDPLLIVGDKVYSTAARPAKPESNEGFHALVPARPFDKDLDLGLPRLP